MHFAQFMELNGHRTESYVRRFARAFGVSGEGLADLRQEAHLAAFRALIYWSDTPGHKSAFNWCAGPMRAAMEKGVRREFGQRPSSAEPIRDRRAPYEEGRHYGEDRASMDGLADILDLKAALARDCNPGQIQRLVMTAFSPDSEVVLAKKAGISRQSLWASNDRTKARLLRHLG